MKKSILILLSLATGLCQVQAQSIAIGDGGLRISDTQDTSHRSNVHVSFGMLDLGINTIVDKTNYASGGAQDFLQNIPAASRTEDLFAQRTGKSINVNIYPVVLSGKILNRPRQRISLGTAIGLQLYNFRWNKPVTYRNVVEPDVILDSLHFSKNKLAFNYLTIPVMINFRTSISKEYSILYGVGVSGGFLLSSWTKQISSEYGKQKNHDEFNFRRYNVCINGEIGLPPFLRLYASYQLTALAKDGLDQHPFCIGVRFLGM